MDTAGTEDENTPRSAFQAYSRRDETRRSRSKRYIAMPCCCFVAWHPIIAIYSTRRSVIASHRLPPSCCLILLWLCSWPFSGFYLSFVVHLSHRFFGLRASTAIASHFSFVSPSFSSISFIETRILNVSANESDSHGNIATMTEAIFSSTSKELWGLRRKTWT